MLNEQNKILFPELEEDNIYRNYVLHEREIVFHFFFLKKKKSIENKAYFYMSFPLTKYSFQLTNFFIFILFYITKYWKIWKTIFIEGFPAKQIERKC